MLRVREKVERKGRKGRKKKENWWDSARGRSTKKKTEKRKKSDQHNMSFLARGTKKY